MAKRKTATPKMIAKAWGAILIGAAQHDGLAPLLFQRGLEDGDVEFVVSRGDLVVRVCGDEFSRTALPD